MLSDGELMDPRWPSPMCEDHWGHGAGRQQHNWNVLIKGCVSARDWLRNSTPSTSYVMSKFWTFIGTAGRKSW